jgi:cobyrinic acid a,c-diamide synthase
MMGRTALMTVFTRGAEGADVSLIEGVMGLFDGASPTTDHGSTAEVAKWLAAPVLAVVDASGMARTIAALGHGLSTFDPELRVVGLVCNRVGSKNHLDLLRSAVRSPPVVGGFPNEAELAFPQRHLGLHTADVQVLPESVLQRWAALAAEWISLDHVIELANSAGPLDAAMDPGSPGPHSVSLASSERYPCRIGIARDEAFHFYYEDNLTRLEQLGATLVPFSPIRDVELPDVDGLYFGGGYPEVHAEALAANERMRAALRAAADGGAPIYAECGGLMYLAESIRKVDGSAYPMVGLLRGEAVMKPRLVALGYVEVETQCETLIGPAGLRFRGHQFRYSELVGGGDANAYAVRARRSGQVSREGFARRSVLASYIHAHWASNPLAARGFVERCAAFADRARVA